MSSAPIGCETAGDLVDAERLEWLVANGIGGYAAGTVGGSLTRGYHGLLVAAVRPPVDRRLMLVKYDEVLTVRGTAHRLAVNRWASGAVDPTGNDLIESFELEGSVPRWRYAADGVRLEKRIWMAPGANTTYVLYTVLTAHGPIDLDVSAVVDNRGFHDTGSVAWPVQVTQVAHGLQVASPAPPLLRILASVGDVTVTGELFTGYRLPAEALRGLRDTDDHVHAGTFNATLGPGESLLLVASAEDEPDLVDGPAALEDRRSRDAALLASFRATTAGTAAPAWVDRLVLAADQFVVARGEGHSVIAGYPWFEDWGRDTMISLPGLTLATGRPEIGASILRAFAGFVSQGMLPNRFPDALDQPVYNTLDATLWFVEAVRAHHDATGDDVLLRELWPTLIDIVDAHVDGTRFGIGVDPADGLLRGGEPGVQLTWMDAIVGGRVITPRIGKPVEVNALWHSLLVAVAGFATLLGEPADELTSRASAAAVGFQRFWSDDLGHCYDVLDGPDGDDPSLRPNQLLAVSLGRGLLTPVQELAVVNACTDALWTPRGLRTLAPGDSSYVGRFTGDQDHRDSAYHQGTAWAWLAGPFVTAHLRVHQDPAAALALLAPFVEHLAAAGLGTVSEVFDGDPPHTPGGCFAQAWSVAEVLRAWTLVSP